MVILVLILAVFLWAFVVGWLFAMLHFGFREACSVIKWRIGRCFH
jgi:hypothetical protein